MLSLKKTLNAFTVGFDHQNPKRHTNLKCKVHMNTTSEGDCAPVLNMLRVVRNEQRFEEAVAHIEDYKTKAIYDAVGERLYIRMADELTSNISDMTISEGEHTLQAFRSWLQRRPNCPYALISLAEVLVQVGWLYRGSGYANTVTEEGWKKLQENVQESQSIMRFAQGHFNEHWYWTFISLRNLNADSADAQEAAIRYSRAIRQLPLSPAVLGCATGPLLPRWGGNFELIEQFANQCTKETQHQIGEGADSIIYSKVIDQGEDVRDLHLNPERFAKGCKDWLQAFPSDYKATSFAADAYLTHNHHLCLDLLEGLNEFHYEAFETGEALTFVNAICRVETGR